MNIKVLRYKKVANNNLEDIEKKFVVPFPDDYRDFLLKYDGAIPEDNLFNNDSRVSVEYFVPVSEIATLAENIEGFPSGAWPIASGGGGDYIYIRQSDKSVFYWNHEIEDGDFKLASSFGDFLANLKPFDTSSIQLKPEQVKSSWVDPDFKPKF